MVDYEILCRPKRPTAATITMFTIANTFTISIVDSPIIEWQSEEWILYEGDDEKDLELGKLWLLGMFERIVNNGVRLVRIESLLPPFFRETRILLGDETSDRKFKVLEEYEPWH